MNGQWQNVYFIQYGYNEQGYMTSRANYNNFNGEWVLGGVYEYTYNENGQKVLSPVLRETMLRELLWRPRKTGSNP